MCTCSLSSLFATHNFYRAYITLHRFSYNVCIVCGVLTTLKPQLCPQCLCVIARVRGYDMHAQFDTWRPDVECGGDARCTIRIVERAASRECFNVEPTAVKKLSRLW